MPTTPPTPRALEVRDAISYRRTPLQHKCGYVKGSTCSDVAYLTWIGESWDLGYKQQVFQCPVCHQVMTEYEAFR